MILGLQIAIVVLTFLLGLFVLLHKGKGGGLSSLFGGGMASNLSGSTTAEKNLNRITVLISLLWIAAIIGLNLYYVFGK